VSLTIFRPTIGFPPFPQAAEVRETRRQGCPFARFEELPLPPSCMLIYARPSPKFPPFSPFPFSARYLDVLSSGRYDVETFFPFPSPPRYLVRRSYSDPPPLLFGCRPFFQERALSSVSTTFFSACACPFPVMIPSPPRSPRETFHPEASIASFMVAIFHRVLASARCGSFVHPDQSFLEQVLGAFFFDSVVVSFILSMGECDDFNSPLVCCSRWKSSLPPWRRETR